MNSRTIDEFRPFVSKSAEMSRIGTAFLLYLALGGIGVATLKGDFRTAVLVFLGGLAVKTWIGHMKRSGTGVGPIEGTASDGVAREILEDSEK